MLKTTLTAFACALATTLCAEEDGLTFHASFDGSPDAVFSKGAKTPETAKELSFVPGFKGQALVVKANGLLAYPAAGNYSKERGSLTMWAKPLRAAPAFDGPERPVFMQRLFTDGKMGHMSGFGFCYVSERYLHASIDRTVLTNREMRGWTQLTLTWDSDGKGGQGALRFYVDGMPVVGGEGLMTDIYLKKLKFDPATGPLFYIGCQPGGATAQHVAIDEVKIYDRVLSPEEVMKSYVAATPLSMEPHPQVIEAGRSSEVNVKIANVSGADRKARLAWSFVDEQGKVFKEGEWRTLSLKPEEKAERSFSVAPDKAGDWSLVVRDLDSGREQVFPFNCPAPLKLGKLENPTKLELQHVETIDCAQEAKPGKFAANDFRIVKAPAGDYVEGSRFAYFLDVEEIQKPYLLTVVYPDDDTRTVTLHMSNAGAPLGAPSSHVQTGYFTGDTLQTSGKAQTLKFIWWPSSKRTGLVFIDRQGKAKAAVSSITIDKIVGGMDGIPRLESQTPKNEPCREIGMEFEDASLCYNFGLREARNSPSLGEFAVGLERMTSFMGYTGMNAFAYPATWYGGPNWAGSQIAAKSERARHHPALWLETLLWDFDQAGFKYYPAINMDHDSTLYVKAYEGSDVEKVRAGADSLVFMNYDGNLAKTWNCRPVYNPLHPFVRKHLLELVGELSERCGDYKSFAGVSLWLGRQNFIFQNAKCGYDDTTVELFEKETGIKIPVEKNDEIRFYKRYRLLMGQARNTWLDWRCEKMTELYKEMLGVIRKSNPDAKLVLALESGEETNDRLLQKKEGVTLSEEWRKRGIDVKKLSEIDGIVLQRAERSDSYRYLKSEGGGVESIDRIRLESSSEDYLKHFSGVRFFEEYFEPRLSLADPKFNPYWKTIEGCPDANNIYYCGPCEGRGRAYLMEMAWTMALTDPLYMSRGGITEEGQGFLEQFQEFAAAFKALPAAKFETWSKSMTEPVFIREHEGKAGHYFYLVNALETDAETSVALEKTGFFASLFGSSVDEVEELSCGKTLKLEKGKLSVKLKPYELKSFLAPAGAKISAASTEISKESAERAAVELSKFRRAIEENIGKFKPGEAKSLLAKTVEARDAFRAKAWFKLDTILHCKEGLEALKLGERRCWLTIGPFDNPEPNGIDAVLAPEKGSDRASFLPAGDGKTLAWEKTVDSEQGIDFAQLYGKLGYKAAFAFIKVKSPAARKATILLGSDDGSKIWLNGAQVFRLETKRGARKWDDRIPVELKAGDNELLVKIDDKTGGWGFYLDIVDENGKPLHDLEWRQ